MELNVEDILNADDVLTRVSRYTLIRKGRMVYIDVHQQFQGNLAADYIAVPNLINIIAQSKHQGKGSSEQEALSDCLEKIKDLKIEDLFPKAAVKPEASDAGGKS